jgi:hypothetical protein
MEAAWILQFYRSDEKINNILKKMVAKILCNQPIFSSLSKIYQTKLF